jgi:dihydrofolate reductase
MGSLTVICNLTLDGVMQAPGHPEEDPRGGFRHGGWAAPYSADAMNRTMGSSGNRSSGGETGTNSAMLLGRRTYERFADYWPRQPDNPYTEALNRAQKYVASRTLSGALPWVNSTLLEGDAVDAVAALKETHDLLVLGSGDLIGSLLPHGLIDEFTLLTHPLVLGEGRRLFPEGTVPVTFDLTSTEATATGVVLARYQAGKSRR